VATKRAMTVGTIELSQSLIAYTMNT